MENIKRYIFLILCIVAFECVAQYNLKKSNMINKKNKSNYLYIFFAIIAYVIICLLLKKCYAFNGIGLINLLWSVTSIIAVIILGKFVFKEEINKSQIIGILFCVVGLYFIFVRGNK